ncbi:NAD(P)H-dependent oxidoreductase subunit E [endosymbiont 'TC1' of Trimyema compressum]|uniref:NADH-quinone oxidoreductase subunit NuoE family protein n=1 Tax=endosymbiont 'TC1' of Trimyema compressum TaxID=243899 RepID=UPI00316ADC66
MKIPVSKVYGVVTFYSYFILEPKGKYIVNVCMGTACSVKGSDAISDRFKQELGINNGETTEDGLFTLEDVRCIGACGLAPVIIVNGKVYGNVKAADVPNIIKEYAGVNHE